MNQTTGKLTRSAPTTAAPVDPFPSLATQTQFRADILSKRIVFNIPQTGKRIDFIVTGIRCTLFEAASLASSYPDPVFIA